MLKLAKQDHNQERASAHFSGVAGAKNKIIWGNKKDTCLIGMHCKIANAYATCPMVPGGHFINSSRMLIECEIIAH